MQIGLIANKTVLDHVCRQAWRTSRFHRTTVNHTTTSRQNTREGHDVSRKYPCRYPLNVWRPCSRAGLTTSSRCDTRYRPTAAGQLYRPRRPKFRRQELSVEEDNEENGQQSSENVVWKPYISQSQAGTPSTSEGSLGNLDREQEPDGMARTTIPNATPSSSSESISSSSKTAPRRTKRIPRIHASAEALEEELQWLAHNDPHPLPIRTILSILIRKHNIKPDTRHYEALLLSNCSPAGSAEQIGEILEEMDRVGIDISPSIFAAAFDALAIHPSSDIIQNLVSLLNLRWMTLTPNMQYSIVLSLIRTDQLELANVFLNDLHASQKTLSRTNRTPVPIYLYVLFLQQLVIRKDYDAVLRLIYKLRDRNALDMDFPRALWKRILVHAAKDGDSWLTRWIWQEWVETMRILPDRDTCLNVLKIAARDKEPQLAESVRQTIENGGSCSDIDQRYNQRLSNIPDADEIAEIVEAGEAGETLNTIATVSKSLTIEEENLIKVSYEKPVESSISSSTSESTSESTDQENREFDTNRRLQEPNREKHPKPDKNTHSQFNTFKSSNTWPFFNDSGYEYIDNKELESSNRNRDQSRNRNRNENGNTKAKRNGRFDPWDALVPPGRS